jgi:arabinose-5-phosphate isomerase
MASQRSFDVSERLTSLAEDTVASGRAVISHEAAALNLLAEALDESFAAAVDQILKAERRVIITGLGKSGHIGRKIAATLAATGTPAFFVHASEAGHGDLGMLTAGDLLIAISNSGFTQELRPIIAHAQAMDLPIIAIVSKAESPLALGADIVLKLPPAAEACPVQVAPTTSTTMTLALGDALAMAVMRRRGVSRETLARWHPGGSIGNRLSPVDELLDPRRPLPLVALDSPVRDAIFEMTSVGKGVVGVLDENGELAGLITDGDLRRNFQQVFTARACDIMSQHPITIRSGTIAEDAFRVMNASKVTVLFVMDKNHERRPLGLLHIHDFGSLF